jgi:hypothetical protein
MYKMEKELIGKFRFAALAAILYLFFGAMQISVALGLISSSYGIPADIMGGFILLVVGTIFLTGLREMGLGIREGVSYIYVGIVIALAFSVIYTVILGGDAFAEAIGPMLDGDELAYESAEADGGLETDDENPWVIWHGMKPVIYLGALPLIGFLIWRKSFTLTQLAG